MSQDLANGKKLARSASPSVVGSVGESVEQPEVPVLDMRQKVVYKKLPWGVWMLEKLCGNPSCLINPSIRSDTSMHCS